MCKRRNKFCAVCQENLTSQMDTSEPNQLFLSLKPILMQRKACLHHHNSFSNSYRSLNECAYRTVHLGMYMHCVRARLVRPLMEGIKTETVQCAGDKCDPKQLIVGMFVSVRLHHSLKEATQHHSNN